MASTPSGAGLEGGTVLGYPRIGRNRELKRAIEAFWRGDRSEQELRDAAAGIRQATWRRLHELGLEAHNAAIPSDFSYYDQVLDAAVLVGAVPPRFQPWLAEDGSVDLRAYSVIARGEGTVAPLEMTKWFDTNYHYLVPEIGPDTEFRLAGDAPVQLFLEGLSHGFVTRPVVVGPVTLLALAKSAADAPAGFDPLSRLDDLLPVYRELLTRLKDVDAPWVQLDESALVSELLPATPDALAAAARHAYAQLGGTEHRPSILVQASYGSLDAALPALAAAPVEGLTIDLVRGQLPDAAALDALADKVVVAGVVDGHNIWRTDLDAALDTLRELAHHAGRVVAGTSTSLFHVPHTTAVEDGLPADVRSWLAFADEKVAEVVALDAALHGGESEGTGPVFEASRAARESRAHHAGVRRADVRARTAVLADGDFRRAPYDERAAAQREELKLPLLPTTTIGSFPQTAEIRRTRAAYGRGEITTEQYEERIRGHIRDVIELQERLGLDVLVHGEAERNDMVQYFAENLDGFDVTKHGWVQSYGSRCTRPSILWGDVSRRGPITVRWSTYAQSLTDKPVKGMLTGPVTILAWSFVRDDQPLGDTANQVALALRDEITDLEAAGLRIVQVDEPAIRELLPLKHRDHDAYLRWSVGAFRLATSGARTGTQVHTHLCYSEFGQIIDAVDGLDADVTSVEAERSKMDIVHDIARAGFSRGIGPGVYDIHSPRVPSEGEVEGLLDIALASIPAQQLWVNPDCGLKTRRYEEVEPALAHLVVAAKAERERLAAQ